MTANIRKIAVFLEETQTEMGRKVEPPTRRAAAVAVVENPCAGRYVEDLSVLMTIRSMSSGTRRSERRLRREHVGSEPLIAPAPSEAGPLFSYRKQTGRCAATRKLQSA